VLKFQKIVNARELGGVRVRNGRRIRPGMLIRTAHLGEATDADIEVLRGYGIKAVVDFRSFNEAGRKPDRHVPGSKHIGIEVVSLNGHLFKGIEKAFKNADSFDEGMSEFVMTEAAKMVCDGFYVSFVDDPDSQNAYARFFREVLALKGAPVLWHCTQGKDRTGLAAAFLLFALGADRDTVLEEFAHSNTFYAEDIARIKKLVSSMGGGSAEMFCIDTLVGVNVPSFIEAFEWIDNVYGGMDSYLSNQLHLTQQDISLLQSYYLD